MAIASKRASFTKCPPVTRIAIWQFPSKSESRRDISRPRVHPIWRRISFCRYLAVDGHIEGTARARLRGRDATDCDADGVERRVLQRIPYGLPGHRRVSGTS